MKHPFDLDDFESFLSEQSEKLRMYPEDKVWRNIQQSLHGKDRWPALTFAAFLTGAFITVLLFLTHPAKELLNPNTSFATNRLPDVISPDVKLLNPISVVDKLPYAVDAIQSDAFHTSASASKKIADIVLVKTLATNYENVSFQEDAPVGLETGVEVSDDFQVMESSPALAKIIPIFPASLTRSEFQKIPDEDASAPSTAYMEVPVLTNSLAPLPASQEKGVSSTTVPARQLLSIQEPEKVNRRALQPKPIKPGRWALQFYATPSVSYRHLIDDKRKVLDQGSGPYALFITQEVNAFVRQKPKLGLEAGAAVLYSLSDNFRIKTGLQLNYRQFGISAYNTITEPARIDLDNGYGIRSMVQLTNISNQSGYREVELNNHFLQLALPIGFDLKIAEAKKVAFFVAASGQLTYQLKSNSYLISADFKNFIKNTDLDRKVNFNTAVEAFVTFKTGDIMWQAGPQIRYQLLPGSKSSYPIREHLMDYGMKVGITKTLK